MEETSRIGQVRLSLVAELRSCNLTSYSAAALWFAWTYLSSSVALSPSVAAAAVAVTNLMVLTEPRLLADLSTEAIFMSLD